MEGRTRHRAQVLVLGDLVDHVDHVDALRVGAVAQVDGIDAQVARSPLGTGPAALADRDPGGSRAMMCEASGAVCAGPAQVVDVAVRDAGQALEADVAVDLELAAQGLLGGGSREVPVGVVELGESTMSRGVYLRTNGLAGGLLRWSRMPPVRRCWAISRATWALDSPVSRIRNSRTSPLSALGSRWW